MNFKFFKKHLFITIFWIVLGITLWLNFQANDSKYDALLQTIAILFYSIILTYYLTEKLLPKALQKKEMKQFQIRAKMVSLLDDKKAISAQSLMERINQKLEARKMTEKKKE